MATEVFINIRDLPELTEIKNGDYIIVETSTGTSIVNFQNFIIPTSNTVLTTTVTQNTDSLISLSAIVTQNTTNINKISSTDILAVSANLTESIVGISNTVESLNTSIKGLQTTYNTISSAYIGTVQITIPRGGRYETGTISPLNNTITLKDIIVTPANNYAARFPAFVSNVTDGAIKLSGTFIKYTTSATFEISAVDINAEADAVYNVMAIKSI